MIKIEKYLYECDKYKIKNPTKKEVEEISQELLKYTTGNLSESDFDNPKLNLYLFQKMVVSDDVDYQFDKYGLGSFTEIMNSEYPCPEFEKIFFVIGEFLSNLVIEILQDNLLMLKEQQMKALNLETIEELDKVTDKIELLKEEKKKRIREKRKEENPLVEVKKLNKFQIWRMNRKYGK